METKSPKAFQWIVYYYFFSFYERQYFFTEATIEILVKIIPLQFSHKVDQILIGWPTTKFEEFSLFIDTFSFDFWTIFPKKHKF